MISLIAAVSSNGVIGRNGELPWHFPEDLKRFKQLTLGRPVIMGRKTFESIGKPLPNRLNIVVSRRASYDSSNIGVLVAASVEEAVARAESAGGEIFCIGGSEIYRQMMSIADKIYLTRIEKYFDGDAFFPAIDSNVWRCVYSYCTGWNGKDEEKFMAYFLEFDRSKIKDPA